MIYRSDGKGKEGNRTALAGDGKGREGNRTALTK